MSAGAVTARTTPLCELNPFVAGSGPSVLFIHGAAGTPMSSFPILPDFALRYHVIAPHLPGAGGVPLPSAPLSTHTLAQQIGQGMEQAGIEKYAVVGHALGCSIAVELAAAFPSCVTAIALTAGFVRARPSLLNAVEMWDQLLQYEGDHDVLGRFLLQSFLRADTLDSRGADWVGAEVVTAVRSQSPGARAHLELTRRLDVRDRLTRTRQPLLVLTPQADRLVDPAHSDDIAQLRPDAVRINLDTGHAVGEEGPLAWRRALDRFIRSRPPVAPDWARLHRW